MGIKEDMQKEMKNIKGDLAMVSKAFHELKVEKDNAKIKARNIIIAILLVLLIVSNLAWLIYQTSLEKVVETTETVTIKATQDGTGINIVGGGDVEYGTKSEDN